MSLRPVLRLPLRQALRHHQTPPPTSRCLHTRIPRRPLLQKPPILQQTRHFAKDGTGTFTGNARFLFRQYPFSMTLATICILAGASSLVWVNWYYQTYIIAAYHNYPEEVAKPLRRAIYYTSTDLNPQEALKYYKQAVQIADEIGMDPFSDEVMGVKIQVAALMERCDQWSKAIEVLERVMADNLRWLGLYDEQYGDLPKGQVDVGLKKKRTRILAKSVAISTKLGEYYANPAIWDRDVAVEKLTWAIETAEKEKRRRKAVGATEEGDGLWMSDDEQGAAMEALALQYEEKNMHYLATPLFLHALSLKETKDCHSVILMNNIASSLAQQSPRMARAASSHAQSRSTSFATPGAPTSSPSGPVATRETMIENASTWAEKALDVAQSIQPPLRNEECDTGCAVATHNLGEFAEMLGNTSVAKRKYQEAVSLSRAIGFQEGVEMSSERLRKLG